MSYKENACERHVFLLARCQSGGDKLIGMIRISIIFYSHISQSLDTYKGNISNEPLKHVPWAIKNFDIGYQIDIIDSTFRHYYKEFPMK